MEKFDINVRLNLTHHIELKRKDINKIYLLEQKILNLKN